MSYLSQVSRALDDEHRSNLELLGRAERVFARAGDPETAPLAGRLVRHLEHEIGRHFGFEEDRLFPRMADAGDGDLAGMLREEHDTIRAVAGELLPLARAAAAGTLAPGDTGTLRRLVLEIVERQVAHIQKETMALLPLLDTLLDDDADRELAFAYASD
ncbi:MAG: hemerythrin domain-containing protein [Rubrivivax sp.]|nr:hemerythrin domain-containing protein [Rubrivivax sp.]MDP3226326.1 hemerythrin domain-containing protein [Rubrivivax sp.]